MVTFRIGLSCLLHMGISSAFDYNYESQPVSLDTLDIQNNEDPLTSEVATSELSKRQGSYASASYDNRQGGIATSIPLLIALGIGGIVAGAAVVQNANEARNNLQSQIDTINARITSSSSTVSTLTSSLPPLTSSINSNSERSVAICSAAGAASVVMPPDPFTSEDEVKTVIEAVVDAVGAFPCP